VNKVFVSKSFFSLLIIFSLACPYLSAEEKAPFDSFEKLQVINKEYAHLVGKPIGTISITVNDIFAQPERSVLFQTANQLKVATKDQVIRRELMFKEGEPLDLFKLQESIRYIRTLRFLREVNIKPIDKGDHVDIEVSARDTWTVIPQIGYSNTTGNQNYSAGFSDSNILGYGKRMEVLYSQEDQLSGTEVVWDDNRVLGSYNRLIAGIFDRSDGERKVIYFGRPFRSLVEDYSYSVESDVANVINRLYQFGDPDYVFREKQENGGVRFVTSTGDPARDRKRFGFGYDYLKSTFKEATLNDYEIVDVDPDTVNKDPALLPKDRLFSGPVFTYREIEPDYISMNYIDRFDFVEDYNLGDDLSVNTQIAPEILGSLTDSYLFSANRGRGFRITPESFLRGEIGFASRIDNQGFANSLFRTELKYYNALGILTPRDIYLGRHTLAASFALDYGDDLDSDRRFYSGADTNIRGYEARSFGGDRRLSLNIEERVHLADHVFDLISVGAASFLDVGGSTDESLSKLISDGMYSDVGVGLRIAFPHSQGSRILRLDIAVPLRDGPESTGNAGEPRIMITGGQLFGARTRSETLGPEKASVEVGFDN
jgi:hypothetical protein